MNRTRPVTIAKARQVHARRAAHKPGRPYNGPNTVSQRAASTKKTARKSSRAKKVVKAS